MLAGSWPVCLADLAQLQIQVNLHQLQPLRGVGFWPIYTFPF
jgi:hypothetical protein